MQQRKSIYIECAPADAFRLVSDPQNDMRWRGYLMSSTHVGGPEGAVGQRIHQSYQYNGSIYEGELHITEYSPPERVTFRTSGQLRARLTYLCRPDGAGTRFSASATFEVSGIASLATGQIEAAVGRGMESDLRRLKRVLEGAQPAR